MSTQGQNDKEDQLSELEQLEMLHTDVVIKLINGGLSRDGKRYNEELEERLRKLIIQWRIYQEEDRRISFRLLLAPTQEQLANFVAWSIHTG